MESSSQNRNRSRSSQPQKRRRRRKKSPLGMIIAVVALLLVGYIMFRVSYGFVSGGNQESSLTGEVVTLTIPEGASTKAIAEILKENGLIDSVFMFRLESKSEDYDGLYRHGTYEIPVGLASVDMMQLLTTGGTVQQGVRLTIPEGYTMLQIAEAVAQTGLATAEEFLAAANSRDYEFDFVAKIPERDMLLEGYLFPETYFLDEKATARDIVNTLLGQFDKVAKQYQTQIDNSAYSLDELVIIASMIESEIRVEEERPVASGVIYNRLAIDMPLQLDATVLYAQGVKKAEVTLEDLNFESDYNTYQNKGLPIGPISNPGESSFAAAISPEENEYLYYVLKEKGGSAHTYTKTYEEFLKAKEAYKKS